MRGSAVTAALRLLAGLAVLGVLVLMVSCVPPFFGEVDAAAGLVRHMTLAGTIGPVSVQTGVVGSSATVRFLPARPTATSIQDVSITSGFVVASSTTADYLTFAYLDTGGNAQDVSALFSLLPVSGADPNFPFYQYDVIAAAQPSVIVTMYDPVTLANNSYQEMQGDPATGQLLQLSASQLFSAALVFPAANPPVGGSMDPTASVPNTFTFMLQNGAGMNTGSATVNNSSSVFAAGTVGPVSPLPGLTPRALVFTNIKGGSLVGQYRSGTAWVTDQWIGASNTTMTGVTKRLDAVLSDGDLVSTEGGNLTLYDSTGIGTQVLSTPLNGMQFCYEAFVGTTPYVFFTLPVAARHGNTIFNVFAIPTSQMRTLGK